MALSKEEIAALKPDALSPAETEAKTEGIGVTKANMATAKCFVSAMLAGAFIAFGGLYFCVFLGDSTMPFAVQRMVGGICFCLGLVLVLCCGAELFTGNSLMCCAKASGKISWSGLGYTHPQVSTYPCLPTRNSCHGKCRPCSRKPHSLQPASDRAQLRKHEDQACA